jgi:3',5'-cyclic AMP phosphodiesterase CpdA
MIEQAPVFPNTSRIVHLSDLHFGALTPALCEPLLGFIEKADPDVVVISGDITQRARQSQFQKASEFIERIKFPKLIVPGNHDIPLWNVFHRFFRPLDEYRAAINENLEPTYSDQRLFIAGMNSARSLEWKEGRISKKQMRRIEALFKKIDEQTFKIIVLHHPLIDCVAGNNVQVVKRADEFLDVMLRIGVDMVLTGHLHHQYACQSLHERAMLVIQAGTALSYRTRGQKNSFNLIDIHHNDIVNLIPHEWNPQVGNFLPAELLRFEKRGLWQANKPVHQTISVNA